MIDKQMINSQRTAVEEWLVEYLNEQILSGSMTRVAAAAQIRVSLERVKLAGAQSAEEADRTAAAMIAALAYDRA